MKKILLLLTIIAFTELTAKAQCCPYVNPVVVMPASINTTTDVLVALDVTTPALGNKISITHTIIGNNISIKGCYYSGLATALQTYLDTVNLGKLSAGNYNCTFEAIQSSSPTECDSMDSKQQNFSIIVATPQSIGNVSKAALPLYPNPCTNILNVPANHRIVIYNMLGNLVQYTPVNRGSISIGHLASGNYLLWDAANNTRGILTKE